MWLETSGFSIKILMRLFKLIILVLCIFFFLAWISEKSSFPMAFSRLYLHIDAGLDISKRLLFNNLDRQCWPGPARRWWSQHKLQPLVLFVLFLCRGHVNFLCIIPIFFGGFSVGIILFLVNSAFRIRWVYLWCAWCFAELPYLFARFYSICRYWIVYIFQLWWFRPFYLLMNFR